MELPSPSFRGAGGGVGTFTVEIDDFDNIDDSNALWLTGVVRF